MAYDYGRTKHSCRNGIDESDRRLTYLRLVASHAGDGGAGAPSADAQAGWRAAKDASGIGSREASALARGGQLDAVYGPGALERIDERVTRKPQVRAAPRCPAALPSPRPALPPQHPAPASEAAHVLLVLAAMQDIQYCPAALEVVCALIFRNRFDAAEAYGAIDMIWKRRNYFVPASRAATAAWSTAFVALVGQYFPASAKVRWCLRRRSALSAHPPPLPGPARPWPRAARPTRAASGGTCSTPS